MYRQNNRFRLNLYAPRALDKEPILREGLLIESRVRPLLI